MMEKKEFYAYAVSFFEEKFNIKEDNLYFNLDKHSYEAKYMPDYPKMSYKDIVLIYSSEEGSLMIGASAPVAASLQNTIFQFKSLDELESFIMSKE